MAERQCYNVNYGDAGAYMIIVRPTPDHNWQWFDINDPTRLTDGLPEQTVTALLPTENILLTKIELPKARHPQKIIPYAIFFKIN